MLRFLFKGFLRAFIKCFLGVNSKGMITEDMLRDSLHKQVLASCDSDADDPEIVHIRETSEYNDSSKPLRKFSGMSGTQQQVLSKAGSMENMAHDCDVKNHDCAESQRSHRLFLATPSQMSEISSLVGSVITNEEGKSW